MLEGSIADSELKIVKLNHMDRPGVLLAQDSTDKRKTEKKVLINPALLTIYGGGGGERRRKSM